MNLSIREGTVLKDLIAQAVGDTGQLPAGLISAILVNGRNCAFRKGMETEIVDGDVVEMLPTITGG
jgi:molybdopterin converting factor small subunit